MPEDFYSQEVSYAPFFEDRIRFFGFGGKEVKLFLDRHFYTPDLSK